MPREVERQGRPSGKDPREGGYNGLGTRYPKSEPQSTIYLGGDSQSEPLSAQHLPVAALSLAAMLLLLVLFAPAACWCCFMLPGAW